MGDQLSASPEMVTGPAGDERHEPPAQTGSGTRAHTGPLKCHSWESRGQSCTRFPRQLPQQPLLHPGDLVQPPNGTVEGGSHIPPPYSDPWSGVSFRVRSLVSVLFPALSKQPHLVVQTRWLRAKPCTSRSRSKHKQDPLPVFRELPDFERVSHGNPFSIVSNFMPLDSNSSIFHID